ncbi:hypothetical protein ACH34C_07065 [Elizabethkingia anophelis]|uniref:hypothetical protein n=1 Tax=Elizabethkingia anophelis TaxID=1117645 RepID=UPI00378708CA
MKIKDAVYKTQMVERSVKVSDEIYGCDCCGKEIEVFNNQHEKLEITSHSIDGDAIDFEFCSWKCVFEYLPKIKNKWFISLPFLYLDKEFKTSGKGIKDFLKLIKK